MLVQILFPLFALIVGALAGWLLRPFAANHRERSTAAADAATIKRLQGGLVDARRWCMQCEAENTRLKYELKMASAASAALPAPVGDTTDDLKMISGVGEKLEKTLNRLGIRQFRQVAALTPENVEWVDERLRFKRLRFKGRVRRERWIQQAQLLAAGRHTDFSRRYGERRLARSGG